MIRMKFRGVSVSTATFAAFVAVNAVLTAAEPWPEWRGPQRNGQISPLTLPTSLDEASVKQLWSAELSPSYSGPVIADGKVFVTETVDEKIETVRAFDVTDGKPLWQTDWTGSLSVPFFAKANGDWIRSTPAYGDGKLYVASMTDLLVCLDASDGSELWKVDFTEKFGTAQPMFGFVCSPLLDDGFVYVQAAEGICKLNADTGEIIWRKLVDKEKHGSAFSSPIIAELHGQQQLIVQTRQELVGITLDAGETLWSMPVEAFRGMNILTPLIIGNKIFTSTYGGGTMMYEVAKSGDGTWAIAELWTAKMQGYMSSPVLVGDAIYLHLRNQRFTCLNVETGEDYWTTTPFGKYWSLITDGDRILALDAKGDLLLIEPSTEEFKLIGERNLTDKTAWAHVAVDDQRIYVRALDQLIVLEK